MRMLLRSLLTCLSNTLPRFTRMVVRRKMTITPKQQRKFQKTTICWICGDKLVTDKGHQDYEKNNQSEITVILLANTEDLLILSAIVSLENQSSPLYFSITYLEMTLIYL